MLIHDHTPIWFNFEQLGADFWIPVTVFESSLSLSHAEHLISQYTTDTCAQMISQNRTRLRRAAKNRAIDQVWVSQALLVLALSALLTGDLPDTKIIDSPD
jgi:hypothetical protein